MSPLAERQHHFWHPFSSMPAASRDEVVLDRGEGVRLWDVDGREYLDGMAALWFCNVGHGRAELADVARDQMARLASFHTFGELSNEPATRLADRVCELAPIEGPCAAFLVSGGSDAVDTAGKIARRYWQVRGERERTVIVARGGAYHGMHAYGTSLAGIEGNAVGWGTIIPDVRHVAPHDLRGLEELFAREGDRIAAFIGEPVIGAGGVHPPTEDYWASVRALCDQHGILLIADEVITGYGRLGRWFGSERYDIQPDLITSAKGISSGYMPVGAVIAGPRILDVLWGDDAAPLRHGYTYSGHPVGAAVALANIDIIEREGLVGHVADLEPVLAARVQELTDHPLVGAVRHAGLMAAVEVDADVLAGHPGAVDEIVVAARAEGVLTRGLVGRSLQLSPPFVVTADELGQMTAQLRRGLDAVAERLDGTGAGRGA
jgi:putrescine aminotransferase